MKLGLPVINLQQGPTFWALIISKRHCRVWTWDIPLQVLWIYHHRISLASWQLSCPLLKTFLRGEHNLLPFVFLRICSVLLMALGLHHLPLSPTFFKVVNKLILTTALGFELTRAYGLGFSQLSHVKSWWRSMILLIRFKYGSVSQIGFSQQAWPEAWN